MLYPTAFFAWSSGWSHPQDEVDDWDGAGIFITGAHNIISDCHVAYSWGDGISLAGEYNTIENCLVEHANWAAIDCAPIGASGSYNVIIGNTVRNGGRAGIVHYGLANSSMTYNNIYNVGLLTRDQGVTYTCNDDSATTTIAYNWVHDAYNGIGIYFDNYSENFLVHHNVIWRCPTGIIANNSLGIYHKDLKVIAKEIGFGSITEVSTSDSIEFLFCSIT